MTAPKPQQMQSRKERLKTSTVRRRRAISCYRSGDLADGDERQLDAGLTEPQLVTGMNAHALRHPLAVHERAVAAEIDERCGCGSEAFRHRDELTAHELLKQLAETWKRSDSFRHHQRDFRARRPQRV